MNELTYHDMLLRYEEGVSRLKDNDDFFSDRFSRNLLAFQKYFPDIYELINSYSPSKCSIFLEEDAGLNLFDAENSAFLYNSLPIESAINKLKEFKKKPNRTSLNISGGSNKTRHEFYMNRLNAYLIDSENQELDGLPDYIPSLLMFGLDFGYSLYFLNETENVGNIHIYEPDLDYFYYSLYAIEWNDVFDKVNESGSVLHLTLNVDESTFIDQYFSYMYSNGLYLAPVTYLYFSRSFETMKSAAKVFSEKYSKQVFGWGFFDDAMMGVIHALRGANNRHYFLGAGAKKSYSDVPIFILANGPSLDDSIDLVRDNLNSAIIVSCGTTTNTLKRLGIRPDFHVDVERMRQTVDKLEVVDSEYLKSIIALTVNVMHPDFYKLFDRVGVSLKPGEVASTLIQKLAKESGVSLPLLLNSAPIVANTALAYITEMGFRNVYLFGVDCGFKSIEKHHSIHSGYYKGGQDTHLINYTKRKLSEFPGNYGGVVYADFIFSNSKLYLEESINRAKSKSRLFSCFNFSDGIKIEGAAPLRKEDFLGAGEINKKEVVEAVFKENFNLIEFGDIRAAFTLVDSAFSDLIDILLSGFDDISSLKDVMKRLDYFNRAIGDCYNSKFPELFELIIGSYTYFASYLTLYLYKYEWNDIVLAEAKEMYGIWSEFLIEMKQSFHNLENFFDEGDGYLMTKYNA